MAAVVERVRALVADLKAQITASQRSEEVALILSRLVEVLFHHDGHEDGHEDQEQHAQEEGTAAPWWQVLKSQAASQVFFSEQYANWADFLLRFVLPTWLPCFARAERAKTFDLFFTSPPVPRLDAFLALMQALILHSSHKSLEESRSSTQARIRPLVVEVVRHRPSPPAQGPPLGIESDLSEEEGRPGKRGSLLISDRDFARTVLELLSEMASASDGGLARLLDHFALQGVRWGYLLFLPQMRCTHPCPLVWLFGWGGSELKGSRTSCGHAC